MTWVAAAVIGGAVIGGVASSSAAKTQAEAAEKAAGASSSAARYQSDIQKQIYEQQREDQAPWRGTGVSALNQLAMRMGLSPSDVAAGGGVSGIKSIYTPTDLLGPNLAAIPELYEKDAAYRQAYDEMAKSVPYVTSAADRYDKYGPLWQKKFAEKIDLNALNERMRALSQQEAAAQPDMTQDPAFGSLMRSFTMADYEADPGYAFRQQQGMQGIERSAAARGGLLSGAALKGIERFGQGLASEEYGNAYNRFQSNQANQYNRLASLAGVGQTANNALQQAGSQFANAMTGISQANAANQGNAMLAAGQARASGYAGIGNALSGAVANWPQQQQQQGYQIPQGYQLGTGTLGNQYAMSQGYQPLDYGTANAGFYD